MTYTVKEIAKHLRDNKKNQTPVVIFTGAGCSKSAGMPLANELIKDINKKYKHNLKSLNDEQRKDYGQCMSQLVPHEQKALIESYIAKAKINWAHIALASLLKKGYVAKILTFNFDNILTRACSLDNFFPPTYDLRVLPETYFSAIPNQSIIHLHGQWSGFDLANSSESTGEQARLLKEYIKGTINTSTTMFIGYSGGADAFFQLVEENFTGQQRLFWIDYSKEPNQNVKKFLNINASHRNFIGEQDADKFLLELAIELKCFPTDLFKDPIKHLKGVCELVNQFPLTTSDTEIDILEDTKKTLEIADASKPAISALKLVEDLHADRFDKIINQVKHLDLNIKPIAEIIAAAYLGKSLTFLTKDNNQFQRYFDKAVEIRPKFYQAYAKVASRLTDQKENIYLEQSLTYYGKCFEIKPNPKDHKIFHGYAVALSKLGSFNSDAQLLEKALPQYLKALAIEPNDADILGNYGSALSNLAQIKKDQRLFEKALKQYEKALTIEPNHINNLGGYGNALSNLARINQDQTLFEKALEQYEKALTIEPNHTACLGNYGSAIFDLARINQDQTLFEKAFEQYEKALRIEPDHAKNLRNYGTAFFGLAQIKQDQTLFEKALTQFEKALQLEPNKTYNLACYYAILNKADLCQNYLLHAENHNTLPLHPYQHLTEDRDLDAVRHEEWFIELLNRLQEKQAITEKFS